MLEIKKDKLTLTKIDSNVELENYKYSTNSDFNLLLKNSRASSVYYSISYNGEFKGLIGLEVIQAMNEFKLSKLHFSINDNEVFYEALNVLLEFAIKDYYTVKIISVVDINNHEALNLLDKSILIFNRDIEVDDRLFKEYKITKPMFLRK